ncbi:hypothetical protein D3C81_1205770 [compost metagenome]
MWRCLVQQCRHIGQIHIQPLRLRRQQKLVQLARLFRDEYRNADGVQKLGQGALRVQHVRRIVQVERYQIVIQRVPRMRILGRRLRRQQALCFCVFI